MELASNPIIPKYWTGEQFKENIKIMELELQQKSKQIVITITSEFNAIIVKRDKSFYSTMKIKPSELYYPSNQNRLVEEITILYPNGSPGKFTIHANKVDEFSASKIIEILDLDIKRIKELPKNNYEKNNLEKIENWANFVNQFDGRMISPTQAIIDDKITISKHSKTEKIPRTINLKISNIEASKLETIIWCLRHNRCLDD